MKKEIKISGMTCNNCVKHVTEALKDVKGVKNVKVSLADQNAVLEVDNVNDDLLKTVIEEVGYDVINIINI